MTEELDYQRGQIQIQVKEHVQILYGLPPEEAERRVMAPKAAPLPPKPFDNCIAGAVLLVQKFCNHLPLYRQQRIFEREGLRLSRKTQCDWSLASAGLLEPIVECLMGRIRAGPPRTVGPGKPVMQLDDCCFNKGRKNYAAAIGATVFAHNLLVLARGPC